MSASNPVLIDEAQSPGHHESLPSIESFEFADNEQDEQNRGLLSDDLEKQPRNDEAKSESVKEGAEYLISTRTKLMFLALYFALNLVSCLNVRLEHKADMIRD